jgi:hypothetical protein
MKKALIFPLAIFALSCSKQAVKIDSPVEITQTISAKVNNKPWVSKTAATNASTAATDYAYFANLSADGKTLTLTAYGTSGAFNNQGADKMGIVIYPFAGAGNYAITVAGSAKAVFASVNGEAVPVDIYNSTDDAANFINISAFTNNKISGTFSFSGQSLTGSVKVSDGTFSDVPAAQ